MSESLTWDSVKEFYKKQFGNSEWALEMMANRDILILCVSGASNKTISNFLDVEVGEVFETLNRVLKFSGWELDLPINPYKLFNENPDPQDFFEVCSSTIEKYEGFRGVDLQKLYELCSLVLDIERKVISEWR